MTSPIRSAIESASSSKVTKVIGEKRIDLQGMIMNRSTGINSHGISGKNQELNGTYDTEQKEEFFYFHGTKIMKIYYVKRESKDILYF